METEDVRINQDLFVLLQTPCFLLGIEILILAKWVLAFREGCTWPVERWDIDLDVSYVPSRYGGKHLARQTHFVDRFTPRCT